MLRDENMKNDRPVYGITVLRYADGRTELVKALDRCPSGISIESCDALPMPTAWQHRHAMLIDACGLVKREAGEPAFQASATIASAEQEVA